MITLGVTETPAGCYSVPHSRPGSRQSCTSTESETIPMEPEVAKALQEELTSSQSWQNTISLDDRLSLTLSEIVHIRTVLTKAEVEALPTEGRVRHDVESRKVCFLCLKTRLVTQFKDLFTLIVRFIVVCFDWYRLNRCSLL